MIYRLCMRRHWKGCVMKLIEGTCEYSWGTNWISSQLGNTECECVCAWGDCGESVPPWKDDSGSANLISAAIKAFYRTPSPHLLAAAICGGVIKRNIPVAQITEAFVKFFLLPPPPLFSSLHMLFTSFSLSSALSYTPLLCLSPHLLTAVLGLGWHQVVRLMAVAAHLPPLCFRLFTPSFWSVRSPLILRLNNSHGCCLCFLFYNVVSYIEQRAK